MTCVWKIEEFLREQRLRCFTHAERMDKEKASVKANNFAVERSKIADQRKAGKRGDRKIHGG